MLLEKLIKQFLFRKKISAEIEVVEIELYVWTDWSRPVQPGPTPTPKPELLYLLVCFMTIFPSFSCFVAITYVCSQSPCLIIHFQNPLRCAGVLHDIAVAPCFTESIP